MGIRQYDKFFGNTPGAAERALANMRKTYGKQDGDRVFWGTVAKRKRKQKPRGWFR